jgi:glutamyl-tRNA(Gln) amidotransferase subunit E
VADDPETAALAIEAVAERAAAAVEGVPEETRGANDDGTTRYLRPLPGAARMYPETDVPPVDPDPSEVETPELLTDRADRYADELGLDAGLAEQVAFSPRMPLFESVVADDVDPTLAAATLESTLTELRRDDVAVEALTDAHLRESLELVDGGEVPREGLDDLLRTLAADPDLTAADAVEEAGLGGVSDEEVREQVRAVVERNEGKVREEGMGAFSALMGECMGALRGKADGDTVSQILREEIGRASGD